MVGNAQNLLVTQAIPDRQLYLSFSLAYSNRCMEYKALYTFLRETPSVYFRFQLNLKKKTLCALERESLFEETHPIRIEFNIVIQMS